MAEYKLFSFGTAEYKTNNKIENQQDEKCISYSKSKLKRPATWIGTQK